MVSMHERVQDSNSVILRDYRASSFMPRRAPRTVQLASTFSHSVNALMQGKS